jgi:hypothetical protein
MYTRFILFLPPSRICHPVIGSFLIPNPVALMFKDFHWVYFFFKKIPLILHLSFIVWPLGTFIKLSNKMLWTLSLVSNKQGRRLAGPTSG